MTNGIFGDFKSTKSEGFQQLPEGKQRVAIVGVIMTNSALNHDGTPKAADKKKPWDDTTPQMAITVIGVDNKGGMTHRLNGLGFKKYSALSKEQVKSGKYSDLEGYACQEVNGKTVRTIDAENTELCKSILNELYNALGLIDATFEDLQAAAKSRTEFLATVTIDPYQGKENYKLLKFRSAPVVVEADVTEA
jgi:hypothetical protein